jgi:hypothetical protein
MSFTLPARPSGRNSTQGSMTMTGDITTASQVGLHVPYPAELAAA